MGERLTDAEIEAMIGRMLREPRVSEGFKLRTKMTATAAWYRSCGCPDTTKWIDEGVSLIDQMQSDAVLAASALRQLRADLAEARAALASLVAAWNQLLPLEPTIANMLANQRRADVRNILLAAVPNLPEIAAAKEEA